MRAFERPGAERALIPPARSSPHPRWPLAGTFRVLLLRKQGQVVGAATLRVFGQRFCEVPFVATREGYRREGNCRRLMRVGGCEHGGVRRAVGAGWGRWVDAKASRKWRKGRGAQRRD